MKEKIVLLQSDIREIEADAIVNPANTEMVHGGGLAGLLAQAAGSEIQVASDIIGPIPLGEAAITKAGKLKARYLIHAASMSLGGRTSESSLREALINTYKRASELDIRSIAIPSIGTGFGGFPVKRAAEIQIQCAYDFLRLHPHFQKIFFVLHTPEDLKEFQTAYNSIFNKKNNDL